MDILEWREVKGFKGYFVSRCGKVKSYRTGKKIILKQREDHKGYLKVQLVTELGTIKGFFVHRLVGYSFIPNPNNKPFINHIDGVKSNNHADNLEWVTARENVAHAYSLGLMNNDTLIKNGIEKSIPVSQICFKTNKIIKVWDSIRSTNEGGFHFTSVYESCLLKRNTHKGFKWRFRGEEHLEYEYETRIINQPVIVYNGDISVEFSSASSLGKALGIRQDSVHRAINEKGRKLMRKYLVEYKYEFIKEDN